MKRKNLPKKIGKIILGAILTAVFSAVICAAALTVYAVNYGKTVNSDAFYELAHAQDRTTHIYYLSHSEDGVEIATELPDQALYSSQNREWASLDIIPERLQNAFIAIEDHRFYNHGGIDPRRTLGALAGYIKGSDTYGGSTITQQLIKNVTGNDEYSVSRKLHEIIFALKLDGELSKSEILEMYLNTIYLSDGCYGVETAAEHYFGKTCGELTVAECCALACIPQSPSKWNPRTNPQNNNSRRETVINRMAELGYISEDEKNEALNEKITVTVSHTSKQNDENEARYGWYTEAVIDETTALLIEKGIAPNRQTASKLLYSGGLSIITAQDPKMQRIAEEYFENERNFPAVDGSVIQPECAAVVIDPRNGNILALVGGRGEKSGDRILNHATGAKRSPGSSIKPLSVYAPAIDQKKITYGTVIDDTPFKFISGSGGKLRPWPQNSPRGYRGLTTVRDAVTRSVNTVSVKVLNMMDKEEIFSLLHDDLGMNGLISQRDIGGKSYTDIADSPLAHGQLTAGVSVKEITGAYTAIAGNGTYHKPKTVLKIYDSEGKLLIDNEDGGKQIFSPETAAITTKLLQGVTKNGTASALKLKNRVACAGKTGTTGDNCDKWFIGYTPELLCGVWFGYSTPKSLAAFSSGGGPAVKVWDGLMTRLCTEKVLGREPETKFPENPNIVTATYCRDSGKRVTAACLADPRGSRIETGYFTKDTVPREYCDCHVLVRYDAVNHGVCGPDCPISNCRTVGMIRVKREFPIPVTVSDAQYVYRPLDGHAPCLDSTEPFFRTVLPRGKYPGNSGAEHPFNRFCYHCYFAAREPIPPDNSDPQDNDPNAYED